MKKFLFLMLILTIALIFVGCRRDRGSAAEVQQGEPTGRLVIYTSIYEDVIEAMDRILSRQFRNADIVFSYGGTGQIQARIAA